MDPISIALLGGSVLGGLFGGGSKQQQQSSSSNTSQSGTGQSITNSTGTMSGTTSGTSLEQLIKNLPPEMRDAMTKYAANLGGNGLNDTQQLGADIIKGNVNPLADASNTATVNGRTAFNTTQNGTDYLNAQLNAGSNTLGKWFGNAPTISATQAADPLSVIAGRGADYAGSYASPLDDTYVNASLNDFDTGVDRGFNALRAGNASAFGNKRTGVAEGVFQSDAARQRGNLASGLRLNAFNTAAGFGQTDADRAFSASSKNADLGLSNAQFNAGLTQQANMFNSNLTDSRQKFDVGQADAGDNRRISTANSLVGAGATQAGVNATNFGNATGYNTAQGQNGSNLATIGSLGPAQIAQLAQLWSSGIGQTGTGSTTGTQAGSTTGNSITNNSFSSNGTSNSTGTGTTPGDPFGMIANLLMAGGYAKKNGMFGGTA